MGRRGCHTRGRVRFISCADDSALIAMPYSIVTGDLFAGHDDPGHPESQARLDAALAGVPSGARRIAPEQATIRDIERVHTGRHIEAIRTLCR
ncbi:MAG TPA: hypothetical protein PLG95_04490, partial [Methanoculleus sp.]|nr:hypothetical protein [Methanoculleus sp.]